MGNERWKSFRIVHLETDLWIAVSRESYDPSVEAYSIERVIYYRNVLDEHIKEYPEFLSSLVPLGLKSGKHEIISRMYMASSKAVTGPMSAVAGAVAEFICKDLISEYSFAEVVVENGGDIFMKLIHPSTISVYAGSSPLSDKIGLVVTPDKTPLSVCCSSATVGHSLSFGTADACVVACDSGALADAYATACCNAVKSACTVQEVTEQFLQKEGVISVVVIKDDKAGLGGKLEITFL